LNRIRLQLVLIILIISFPVLSQTESLVTDRPDFTESSSTVPLNSLQVETGLTYNKENESINSISILGTLFRYGLTSGIELRAGTEYLIQEISILNQDLTESGISGAFIGTKLQLNRNENVFPQTALIVHLNLPVGNENLRIEKIVPEAVISFSKDLSDIFSAGINFGSVYQSEIEEFSFSSSLALGIGLTENLGCFVEYFGIYQAAEVASHNIDGGFTYLLNDDTQLDIFAGTSLGVSNNYFLGGGISLRFPEM
jgi:hypothetical protein